MKVYSLLKYSGTMESSAEITELEKTSVVIDSSPNPTPNCAPTSVFYVHMCHISVFYEFFQGW